MAVTRNNGKRNVESVPAGPRRMGESSRKSVDADLATPTIAAYRGNSSPIPYPIRADLDITLECALPRDLTKSDVERLSICLAPFGSPNR